MVTWEDVRRVVTTLPEVTEGSSYGRPAWKVRGKMFAWERPLRPRDIDELGVAAPEGSVLGVRVADLGEKEALLASEPEYCFTISHFQGYSAVLVRLELIGLSELRELLVEAWLVRAPKRLAGAFHDDEAG